MQLKADTLHPTPYTHTPYTLHPAPYILHPSTYTLHPTPYTQQPTHCTVHPEHPSRVQCFVQPLTHTHNPKP